MSERVSVSRDLVVMNTRLTNAGQADVFNRSGHRFYPLPCIVLHEIWTRVVVGTAADAVARSLPTPLSLSH